MQEETSFNLILPAFVYNFALSTLRMALVGDETCGELNVGNISLGRSRDRIPVVGEIFRTRPDRPWAHPASYTMDTGSFPGIKRPGRGFDHPPNLTPRLREE